jgi:hypothetical protein
MVTQILVKLIGLPESSSNREDYTVLWHRFPSTAAWGQAASSEGGGCDRYNYGPSISA